MLNLTRLSEDLATQYLDEGDRKLEVEAATNSLQPAPVRLCLNCNLGEVNLYPCSTDHLERRLRTDSILVGAKRKLRRVVGSNAESNFRRKISNQEDTAFLEANNAKPKTRLLAEIMKLEPKIHAMHDLGTALPSLPTGRPFAVFDGLSTTAKLLRARVMPAGAYHLALKFGPLVFESGVKG